MYLSCLHHIHALVSVVRLRRAVHAFDFNTAFIYGPLMHVVLPGFWVLWLCACVSCCQWLFMLGVCGVACDCDC